MSSITAAPRPWYREPWPWFLMAGPGLVIVAAVITIWLAVGSSDGVVSDDYYKEGLAINQSLARDEAASQLGLSADVMVGKAQIRVLLRSSENAPLSDQLNLRVIHPTRAGQDQVLVLAAEGAGVYHANLSKPMQGRWHLVLEDAAQKWRLQGDWRPDSEGGIHMKAASRSAS